MSATADMHSIQCCEVGKFYAAREQWAVAKHPGPKGTVATVEALDPGARVEEIARMLGGLKITEATRKHATEMLQNARPAGTPSRKVKAT